MVLPKVVDTVFSHMLFKNSVLHWLVALGIVVLVYIVLSLARRVWLERLRRMTHLIHLSYIEPVFDALCQTKSIVLFIVAIWAGSQGLKLPPTALKFIQGATIIGVLIQAGLWVTIFLNSSIELYRKERLATNPSATTSLNVISIILKIVTWVFVMLLLLENLGINITALVAGLGIGGIAVALALQSILGDIFASVVILVDKPFMVGDFLTLDGYMGTVEYIGMKTTRIRSLSGEQIVLSNSGLLNNRIRNYGRMYERRVAVKIGVTYQTPRTKLELIPKILNQAITSKDKTRFDRAHFTGFGDSSLDFEYVYYVLTPDYNSYMDINQDINLEIHRRFEEEKIDFAFPTRSIFIENAAPVPGVAQ